MTARDTHEQRLAVWPRLATFPSTNGFLALVMLLWLATGACSLAPWAVLEPSQRWYQALEVLTGIVVVQFIGKRGTDATLWRRDGGNGGVAATPGQEQPR